MPTDPKFFDRADAHIRLSNEQLSDISRGKVSASMMFAAARFNAWISACGFDASSDMAKAKGETLEYFVTEYRKMLEENLTAQALKLVYAALMWQRRRRSNDDAV